LLTFSQTAGCTVWKQAKVGEAMMLTYRDYVWAKRAYNLRYKNCNRPYAEHFEAGFRAGYTDVSQGGDGYIPALPPAEYRGYEFQSADGAKCVNSWFEGYPAGVAAAKRDKTGNYNDVMISRMINSAISQESVDAKLPNDIPVVSTRPPQPPTRTELPPIRSTFTPVDDPNSSPIVSPAETVAPPQANVGPAPTSEIAPVNYEAMPTGNDPLPMAMPNTQWESQPPGSETN
jgi:hypothetical protein